MSAPVLEIDGLTAGYDGAAVVRDLDLDVAPGEIVALLGANGAGKTTTLRAVSGLVRPMEGAIRFQGQDLRRVQPSARAKLGIAHVPENRGLFFGLTVAEHLRLGYRGERLDADVAYRYFPALAELRDRRCGLLSGGEQQMLARRAGARPPPDAPAARRAQPRPRPGDRRRAAARRAPVRGGERLRRRARRAAHRARPHDRRPRLRALPRGDRAAGRGGASCGPTTSCSISSYFGEHADLFAGKPR